MKTNSAHFNYGKTPFLEKVYLICIFTPIAIFISVKCFFAKTISELRMGYYMEGKIKRIGRIGLKRILPHRGRALMIDGIIYNYEKPSEITAIKKIRKSDPFLKGHFPNNPIYPGVMLIECANLACAALVKLTVKDANLPLFMGIDRNGVVKLRKPIFVGSTLIITASQIKNRGNKIFKFNAEVVNQDGDNIANIEEIVGMAIK